MSSRAPRAGARPGRMSRPPARRATCEGRAHARARRTCTSSASRSGRPAGSCRTMAAASRPIICTRAGATISTGTSSWSLTGLSGPLTILCLVRAEWKFGTADDAERRASRILVVEPNRDLSRRPCAAPGRRRAIACRTAECAQARAGRASSRADRPRPRRARMPRIERRRAGADGPRRRSMWRDIPVLLLTGKSEPKGAVRAYEARRRRRDRQAVPLRSAVRAHRPRDRSARGRCKRFTNDNAALDARVVERAIELGEMRDRWLRARPSFAGSESVAAS